MNQTLEQYLESKGVNDLTDQEKVNKLTAQYMISNANSNQP